MDKKDVFRFICYVCHKIRILNQGDGWTEYEYPNNAYSLYNHKLLICNGCDKTLQREEISDKVRTIKKVYSE